MTPKNIYTTSPPRNCCICTEEDIQKFQVFEENVSWTVIDASTSDPGASSTTAADNFL